MTEKQKLTKQRDLVAAAFNAIETKSMNLAIKAEDNTELLADAFGELLDFIQQTDIRLNKELSKLEGEKWLMGYKKDLENARTVEDCQVAYENECTRRLEKYTKRYKDHSRAFTQLVAEDFSIWFKAQMRLRDLGIMDADIKSKY